MYSSAHYTGNQLTSLPVEIGKLASLEFLYLDRNKLLSLPTEIGQLVSLGCLDLQRNPLTRLPIEIGKLTSLSTLRLQSNKQLKGVSHVIRELRARGCDVKLDPGVTIENDPEMLKEFRSRGVKVSTWPCECCTIS